MNDDQYQPETPKKYWRDICFYPVNDSDCQETAELLKEEPEFRRDLGATGMLLATRVRAYQFGDLADENGEKFDIKQKSILWLICETACLLGSIEKEAKQTAPLN